MPESFRSFNKRVKAELPLVSDEEKEFEKEAKEIQAVLDRRNARRQKLLWSSIPLLVRNWKLFRKFPRLYNIPIDFVHFGDFFRSIPFWEPQNHNVPLGGLVAAWKMEDCQLSCPHCQSKAFLVPQHEHNIYSFGYHSFLDSPSNNDSPDNYYAYCEKCGKIIDCDDYSGKTSHKQSKFESVMHQWNMRANPEVPALQFEHALQLLILCETCGEESDEFRPEVPRKMKKKSSYEEFGF
jgi:hypothetical protein